MVILCRKHANENTITLVTINRLVGWLSSVLRPRQHSIGYMGDGINRL